MPTALGLTQKYLPAVYWLFFACLCAVGATLPGYVPRSMPAPPYPVTAVIVAWIILALLICWRGRLFAPSTDKQGPGRLVQKIGYVFILVCLLIPILGVDMGDLLMVMSLFALCELTILLARLMSLALRLLKSKLLKAHE